MFILLAAVRVCDLWLERYQEQFAETFQGGNALVVLPVVFNISAAIFLFI
jgi:hypothetical protein